MLMFTCALCSCDVFLEAAPDEGLILCDRCKAKKKEPLEGDPRVTGGPPRRG